MQKTYFNPLFTGLAIFSVFVGNANAAEKKSTNSTTYLSQVTVVASKSDGQVDGYKTGLTRSSTRTETPLIDVPQSISVVTQDQIRDQNISDLQSAMQYVPGVGVAQGENNRDQIVMRGNSSTADFFVDAARDDLQYYRDFYNVDRIEVLKGPSAMAFGRGGAGGVINRVLKSADGSRKRRLVLTGGSFENRRFETDLGDKINPDAAFRLNAMYEKSSTFRRYGDLERYGISPTATFNIGEETELKTGYEHFSDQRFNDRGLPSQNGEVYATKAKTFFGNPNQNDATAKLDSVYAIITHDFDNSLQLRNHTRYTKNSKFYQNVYANSAVDSSGNFALAAYNDSMERRNFTNQTDLTKKFETGSVKHLALFGAEVSNQESRAMRNTGYFNGSATARTISAANSLDFTPIVYRQSDSDNNSASKVKIFGTYFQDQIDINKHLQLVGGLRYDRFELDFHNLRNYRTFKQVNHLVSPRAGIVIKPQKTLSFYGSYSVTYLPSSGDQFSALTTQTVSLDPEEMKNYEIGAKWDVNPRLNLSAAIYQLNRTNSRANDPVNAGFFILTGESQTRGLELGATGKVNDAWQVVGGYSFQDAETVNQTVISQTTTAQAGSKLALTPRNKFSLWNKYDFTQQWSAGLGVIKQSSQFAAADNAVKLRGFTRLDGAAYYKINQSYRLQLNVENLLGEKYIQTAHNNNNIQPGSPRAYKLSLIADF